MEQININNSGSIEAQTTTNTQVWTWNIKIGTWTENQILDIQTQTWNIEIN